MTTTEPIVQPDGVRHPDGSLCVLPNRCGFDGYLCNNYPRRVDRPSAGEPRTQAGRRMLIELPDYIEGQSRGRHWPLHSILSIEEQAAARPPSLSVERIFRLYADAHLSNIEGQRAGMELAAMAEDWFDANVEGGWPLPRVARLSDRE